MALFKKKLNSKKTDICPICDSSVDRGDLFGHNLAHAEPLREDPTRFMWVCKCGKQDGVWDDPTGAAAGLTLHMTECHGLIWP